MDGEILSVRSISGKIYQYVWTKNPSSGAMVDEYEAPDTSYVVAFYKEELADESSNRLLDLVHSYQPRIFDSDSEHYWRKLYNWPLDVIDENGKTGVVFPITPPEEFYFHFDGPATSMKGMAKEGKWFASPEHRWRNLDEREVGDFRCYFNVCLQLARGVRQLHHAGLALTDLSYHTFLIDPVSGGVHFINLIDNVIVPGKYPPNFIGTPDFIAPEVYETMSLPKNDLDRNLPSQETDRHSLAVMLYQLLLCRHPLRGKMICDIDDPQKDEQLSMGAKAVFIEDPTNKANRYTVNWVHDNYPKSKWPYLLPWMDLDKLPYTILGPHLKELFDRAFVQGLHNPSARPAAFEWEDAIIQTMDLMIPCQNPNCKQKWFVFDNSASCPKCPFCGAAYTTPLPMLNLYNRGTTSYRPTGSRVMVYNGTRLYQWHSNPKITRNEKITNEQKKSIVCFQFHQGKWYLRNVRALGMMDLQTKKPIPADSVTELKDGAQIRLDDELSRIIYVQIVNKEYSMDYKGTPDALWDLMSKSQRPNEEHMALPPYELVPVDRSTFKDIEIGVRREIFSRQIKGFSFAIDTPEKHVMAVKFVLGNDVSMIWSIADMKKENGGILISIGQRLV